MQAKWALAVAMTVGAVGATGCRVESDKRGGNDNVKIATPFGGMQVKTNDVAVEGGLGLPVYPGAELQKKKDKDNSAADVNFSFGSFQLRVKAAAYTTPDGPDRVKAFYRKALERYGVVIECQNNKPIGIPTRTPEGLTCDNEKDNHIAVDDDLHSQMELKAGSRQHQHIVGIEPDGAGARLSIVALDLPGKLFNGDKGDKGDKDKDADSSN
jgi:hypothetical protein